MSIIQLANNTNIKPREIGSSPYKNKIIGLNSIRYKIYKKFFSKGSHKILLNLQGEDCANILVFYSPLVG